MPQLDVARLLLIAAVAFNGILTGASLDQSIKQLPARRRMGVIAFSAYSRAADLGNGIVWYATIGVGAALFTIGAAVSAYLQVAPAAAAIPPTWPRSYHCCTCSRRPGQPPHSFTCAG